MSRFMQEEKGSVAVLIALAMVALIGFSALAIDVGYLYFRKSQLMSIADAASLAGAVAMRDSLEFEEKQDKIDAIEAAVTNNLQDNGFNEQITFEHDEQEPGSASNTVYVLYGDKQVHVNLALPEGWLFAKVLALSTGGALDEPVVGSLARAEVASSLGVDIPDHAIISFNKGDDGEVFINGDVTIKGNATVSIHANNNIRVAGNKDGPFDDVVGSCVVSALGDWATLFSDMKVGVKDGVKIIESPFMHLLYDGSGNFKIKSESDLRNAFPNAASVMYYVSQKNQPINLPYEGEGARVVYIKPPPGNTGIDLAGQDNISIKTNGGLVIIEGFLEFGAKKFDVDGIVYATDYIKIHGNSVSISGGLWSQKNIELKGTVDSFSYNPLDVSLGPQKEIFSIKMVR